MKKSLTLGLCAIIAACICNYYYTKMLPPCRNSFRCRGASGSSSGEAH